MSQTCTRLPALPLVTNDPYFSIWCAADRLTDAETSHWTGVLKPLRGTLVIDGKPWRYLGLGDAPALPTQALRVTPMATEAVYEADGVELTLRFVTPLPLKDMDRLSTPITLIEALIASRDGAPHEVSFRFFASDTLCYDGENRPAMLADEWELPNGLYAAYAGQRVQKPLCHSGDHITIDWGYLYLAGGTPVRAEANGLALETALRVESGAHQRVSLLLGYDDVASIQYFGHMQKAWYARNGKTFVQALEETWAGRDALLADCDAFDAELLAEARERGGEDYALIVSAAYRHTIAAHKLIADPQGKPVFLSKENDSNGCIGTVDLSYPSAPLFLKYNPELVRAMARPVLYFASLPVWTYDFAPHDVGRYPYATGQVYARIQREPWASQDLGQRFANGDVMPPYYLYPASAVCYEQRRQMPVEECGNMLVILAAAARADGDDALARAYRPQLGRWAQYLLDFGEDPGEQLCTDDFAGHLARNVNLAAKAVVGVACYALLLEGFGEAEQADVYRKRAKEMAKRWLERADQGGYTALTFDGAGWSMKYNLAWDRLLGLGLLPDDFYAREMESYLGRINDFGLPLDSRKSYTKSDWLVWVACMTPDRAQFDALIAPLARFLRETPSRVPFSDWYDTKTGLFEHFIARSVQGGVFMPLLPKIG